MIPARLVRAVSALGGASQHFAEVLGPFLFDIQSQRIRQVFFIQFRGLFRRREHVQSVGLSSAKIFSESFYLIHGLTAKARRRFEEKVKKSVDAEKKYHNQYKSQIHISNKCESEIRCNEESRNQQNHSCNQSPALLPEPARLQKKYRQKNHRHAGEQELFGLGKGDADQHDHRNCQARYQPLQVLEKVACVVLVRESGLKFFSRT